ncbi:hypothetical protein [Neisseria bergeri]|uniref:hypothetical protein n=1 Tax=Neisseria bergeri TaxID=1906581 RepID=UPI0027E18F51|nr:hypothetical protein [Neisseria bergeri]
MPSEDLGSITFQYLFQHFPIIRQFLFGKFKGLQIGVIACLAALILPIGDLFFTKFFSVHLYTLSICFLRATVNQKRHCCSAVVAKNATAAPSRKQNGKNLPRPRDMSKIGGNVDTSPDATVNRKLTVQLSTFG